MTLRQEGGKTLITPASGGGGNVTIDGPLGSQPAADSVSVAIASDQLPLPVLATIDTTGLATDANQVIEIARLTSILAQLVVALDTALSTRASEATVASILSQIDVALSTRASEATLLTLLTQAAFEARINTLGQKTMAASTPVVLPSNQSAIPVTGTLSHNSLAPAANNVGALVAIGNGIAPSNGEGRQMLLSTDLFGGLRVVGNQRAVSVATWTSGTPLNSTQVVQTTGYASVSLVLAISDIDSGSLTFETTVDSGSNWVKCQMMALNDETPFTSLFRKRAGASFYRFDFDNSGSTALPLFFTAVPGTTQFRVRLSAGLVGAGFVDIRPLASSSVTPYEAIQQFVRGSYFDNSTDNDIVTGNQDVFPMGAIFDDTVLADMTSGRIGMPRITTKRGLHSNLRTSAGLELLGQQLAAASIPVVLPSDQPISLTALVSDVPESFTPGTSQPLSMTTEGRVRVSSADAKIFLEFFRADSPFFNVPNLTSPSSLQDDGHGISPRTWLENL
jgi:hypothetical protein